MIENNEALVQSLIDSGQLKSPRMIEAFRSVDRGDFVPERSRSQAYENSSLLLAHGQYIAQPGMVAFMLELLNPQEGQTVLDVGTSSGWQAALLAFLVGPTGKIITIERLPEFCEEAAHNLQKHHLTDGGRIELLCQNPVEDIPEIPYDGIIASTSVFKDIPPLWNERLKTGGKIAASTGETIVLLEKTGTPDAQGKEQISWQKQEFPAITVVPPAPRADPKHPQTPTPANPLFSQTKSGNQEVTPPIVLSRSRVFWVLILIVWAIASATIAMIGEIYYPHATFEGQKLITIMQGLGSRNIGTLLKSEKVIRSKWAFVTYVSLRGEASLLKPGAYLFPDSTTIPQIAHDLVQGVNSERQITIPEGWNVSDIADYLDAEHLYGKRIFLELTSPEQSTAFNTQFPFLKERPTDVGLDGYLFPDTYRIFITAPPKDLVVKMLENFDQKVTLDLREEAQRKKRSLYEIITMASLIEKEVAEEKDRAIVSGILWKRLSLGIPLQVDATVIYLTGKRTTKVPLEDLAIDSPYNTYKYSGLPKGPIANPGLSAIKAALSPKSSAYLYYLSTPEGRTIFSRTLDEHNTAKARYLK